MSASPASYNVTLATLRTTSPSRNKTRKQVRQQTEKEKRRARLLKKLEIVALRERGFAAHNFLMSHKVHLVARLNVIATNFGYFGLSYVMLMRLVEISSGDRMAFPAALEALKYSHRAHGFFLLAIAIISTLFHSLQMDVMRDAREAYCSCCAGVRKRRINRNEEKPTDDKATQKTIRAPRRSRSEPDFENVVSMERNGDERTLKSSASVKTAVAERIQWVSSQKQSFHPIKRTGSPHSYQLKSSAFHQNTPGIVKSKTRERESSPVSALCLSTETCDPLVTDRKFSALSPSSASSSTTTTPSSTEYYTTAPKSFREEDEMEDEEKIRNAIKNYRWGAVSNLICCDVVTAVSYCLFLMLSHGEKTVVVNGLLPLSVLWFGASSKAKGRYWNYAIWHAVWHVLSAALMAKVLIA